MADETYKIDPAIREKYRIEREKRLRNEGNDQYQSMTGRFAHYNEDPYADPEFSREAMEKEVEVVIVGAGFGGLVAGVNLQNEGIDDILLIV
ncbi:MAG: hypothetical protein OXQ29_27400 [Rhodospirillaceae bacterium]|nr:hypothetical protein [Rhodospirillaceae bacterium]